MLFFILTTLVFDEKLPIFVLFHFGKHHNIRKLKRLSFLWLEKFNDNCFFCNNLKINAKITKQTAQKIPNEIPNVHQEHIESIKT